MEVTIGSDSELIRQAQDIRYQVFTLEQDIPKELDLDGLDESSIHALITLENQPVATARLTLNGDGSSTMARVAVTKTHRGAGLSSKLVKAVISHAREIGVQSIEIHAHNYLKSFYERFGFQYIQEVEIVGEHQLIEMQHSLVRAS
ncbi:GNAT family N-acetyltransferase [Bacterioplanes sanyensis]|uniref:GNAT family N-acetyltransferase n=1 Tax=Bacterioplanes sanyensis TaxID=1249553 RepID=A0A222FNW7_9GAMM|nr:GNAT family N-acetyltransferase [Bacterioplanes sanyensis]ASP40707.1 GNAT family N-acetyltransferase [Bacterioplanes sanyensis]